MDRVPSNIKAYLVQGLAGGKVKITFVPPVNIFGIVDIAYFEFPAGVTEAIRNVEQGQVIRAEAEKKNSGPVS